MANGIYLFLDKYLLLIMGTVVILFVLSISCVTWWWADDFAIYNLLMENKSIIDSMLYGYNHWGGRNLSLGIFLHFFLIKYFPPAPAIFIWALSFILTTFIFVKIIFQEIGGSNLSLKEAYIMTALFSCVLWMGMGLHISETIYWVSGGFYTFTNLLGMTWVYFINRIQKTMHYLHYFQISVPLFILSFIAAMSNQNLSPALLVFLCLTWFQDLTLLKQKKGLIYVPAALGLIAGTVIIFLAPGNFVRAAYSPESFILSPNVLFINYLRILIYYTNWSVGLILLSIIAAWVISHIGKYIKIIHPHDEIRYLTTRQILTELFGTFKYFFAALATIVPFIAVPTFAFSHRTSIFFMTFMSLFVVLFINWLNIFSFEKENYSKILQPVAKMLLICLFLVQIGVIATQLGDGFRIKGKILERETHLQRPELRNTDVVLPPLETGHVPFFLRFGDIESDPNNWVNISLAKYYHLKSIRIAKQ
jgi:low affinity Fe/Cu permease